MAMIPLITITPDETNSIKVSQSSTTETGDSSSATMMPENTIPRKGII